MISTVEARGTPTAIRRAAARASLELDSEAVLVWPDDDGDPLCAEFFVVPGEWLEDGGDLEGRLPGGLDEATFFELRDRVGQRLLESGYRRWIQTRSGGLPRASGCRGRSSCGRCPT